jgi:hypothetical protein
MLYKRKISFLLDNINAQKKTIYMQTSKLTHSGNILIAGFVIMILGMSTLVYLTLKEDVSMVSKNYYEQELIYDQKLKAMDNTLRYHQDFKISYKEQNIQLQIPQSLSQYIQEGKVHFYCPSNAAYDYTISIEASTNGVYSIPTAQLNGHRYIVKISFTSDGNQYYKEMNL